MNLQIYGGGGVSWLTLHNQACYDAALWQGVSYGGKLIAIFKVKSLYFIKEIWLMIIFSDLMVLLLSNLIWW